MIAFKTLQQPAKRVNGNKRPGRYLPAFRPPAMPEWQRYGRLYRNSFEGRFLRRAIQALIDERGKVTTCEIALRLSVYCCRDELTEHVSQPLNKEIYEALQQLEREGQVVRTPIRPCDPSILGVE